MPAPHRDRLSDPPAPVRPRAGNQVAVRSSAQYNLQAVSDPEPYQQFFAALERAMFLTANEID